MAKLGIMFQYEGDSHEAAIRLTNTASRKDFPLVARTIEALAGMPGTGVKTVQRRMRKYVWTATFKDFVTKTKINRCVELLTAAFQGNKLLAGITADNSFPEGPKDVSINWDAAEAAAKGHPSAKATNVHVAVAVVGKPPDIVVKAARDKLKDLLGEMETFRATEANLNTRLRDVQEERSKVACEIDAVRQYLMDHSLLDEG